MTDLITLWAATDNSGTTGTFSFQADIAQNTFSYIRIPKGTVAKIWAVRTHLNQCQVLIKYSLNVSTGTPSSPFVVWQSDLASTGSLELEKRRPILLRSETGKEGIQVTWNQAVAALSYCEIDLELGAEEEEG